MGRRDGDADSAGPTPTVGIREGRLGSEEPTDGQTDQQESSEQKTRFLAKTEAQVDTLRLLAQPKGQ